MIHTIKAVFVAQHRVDFRKGIFSMLAEMRALELDPYAGDCLIFVHPSYSQLRIVGGNVRGAWMTTRLFEGGPMQKPFQYLLDPAFVEISRAELELFLEGVTYHLESVPKTWRSESLHSDRCYDIRVPHEQTCERQSG